MIPTGVLVHDQKGKILYLNPEGLRLAGAKSVEDFADKDVLASIHPDDRAKVREQNRLQHTEDKIIPPVELRLLTLNGRPYSAEVTSKPILYGGIPAVLVLFQDLSPRKRAEDELRAAYEQITASEEELRSTLDEMVRAQKEQEKSEKNFQTLVDSAPDGIYTHFNDRFLYLNRTALQLFGASDAIQLAGTSVWDRIHPSFHSIVRERVKHLTVDQEPVGQYDEVYLRLDGSPFDVEVTAVPYLHEGQNGTLVMFRDITERKKREGVLLAKIGELTADRRDNDDAGRRMMTSPATEKA
jgi:PAS domain S-box-containing protein